MRILQLCPTMHRAGTWFRCLYLSQALARRGHEVTLVKVSADARLVPRTSDEGGVRLVETPRGWGGRISHGGTRLPTDLVARSGLVLGERFDLVHTYSHHVNAMGPGLLSLLRPGDGALVVDWDDLWTEGGLYGDFSGKSLVGKLNYAIDLASERWLKRLGHGVTVVSEDLRRRSVAHGVPPERIHWLPNGAPVDALYPGDRDAARVKLGLPLARRIGIFVGFGQYDVDLVLDALALLAARGEPPLVAFTGPNPDVTRREASRRGLDEHVRVGGLVPFDELRTWLQASDVGLLPYADKPLNRARWPMKLGDYLAAGLPTVTCRVGEMGRFLAEHPVGVATEPSAASFAEGFASLVARRDLAVLQLRAREVAEDFTWDALAERLEPFYEACRERAR